MLHSALEVFGLLGTEELQTHGPLVLVLVRIFVFHLLQLGLLTSGHRLRCWLLFIVLWLLLLLFTTFLLRRSVCKSISFVILGFFCSSISLLCLLLPLILHLLKSQHLFFVLTHLDDRVRFIVEIGGGCRLHRILFKERWLLLFLRVRIRSGMLLYFNCFILVFILHLVSWLPLAYMVCDTFWAQTEHESKSEFELCGRDKVSLASDYEGSSGYVESGWWCLRDLVSLYPIDLSDDLGFPGT